MEMSRLAHGSMPIEKQHIFMGASTPRNGHCRTGACVFGLLLSRAICRNVPWRLDAAKCVLGRRLWLRVIHAALYSFSALQGSMDTRLSWLR